MDLSSTHNVNDLPVNERKSLENLLGVPLDSDQQLLILTYKPSELPGEAERIAARQRIERTLLVNQQFATEQGVSDFAAIEAVSEAIDQVRRRR